MAAAVKGFTFGKAPAFPKNLYGKNDGHTAQVSKNGLVTKVDTGLDCNAALQTGATSNGDEPTPSTPLPAAEQGSMIVNNQEPSTIQAPRQLQSDSRALNNSSNTHAAETEPVPNNVLEPVSFQSVLPIFAANPQKKTLRRYKRTRVGAAPTLSSHTPSVVMEERRTKKRDHAQINILPNTQAEFSMSSERVDKEQQTAALDETTHQTQVLSDMARSNAALQDKLTHAEVQLNKNNAKIKRLSESLQSLAEGMQSLEQAKLRLCERRQEDSDRRAELEKLRQIFEKSVEQSASLKGRVADACIQARIEVSSAEKRSEELERSLGIKERALSGAALKMKELEEKLTQSRALHEATTTLLDEHVARYSQELASALETSKDKRNAAIEEALNDLKAAVASVPKVDVARTSDVDRLQAVIQTFSDTFFGRVEAVIDRMNDNFTISTGTVAPQADSNAVISAADLSPENVSQKTEKRQVRAHIGREAERSTRESVSAVDDGAYAAYQRTILDAKRFHQEQLANFENKLLSERQKRLKAEATVTVLEEQVQRLRAQLLQEAIILAADGPRNQSQEAAEDMAHTEITISEQEDANVLKISTSPSTEPTVLAESLHETGAMITLDPETAPAVTTRSVSPPWTEGPRVRPPPPTSIDAGSQCPFSDLLGEAEASLRGPVQDFTRQTGVKACGEEDKGSVAVKGLCSSSSLTSLPPSSTKENIPTDEPPDRCLPRRQSHVLREISLHGSLLIPGTSPTPHNNARTDSSSAFEPSQLTASPSCRKAETLTLAGWHIAEDTNDNPPRSRSNMASKIVPTSVRETEDRSTGQGQIHGGRISGFRSETNTRKRRMDPDGEGKGLSIDARQSSKCKKMRSARAPPDEGASETQSRSSVAVAAESTVLRTKKDGTSRKRKRHVEKNRYDLRFNQSY